MATTALVPPQPLSRTAVLSMRQSTGHQGLTNPESHHRQHARRDQAHRLGWPDARVEGVEADLGRSAPSTAGRDGDQARLAEVALGQGGIVLSDERTRLSRHGPAGSPWLDRCADHQGLLADRAGVDAPSTPNGRLRLGRNGILRAVARPTWRGRLLAGGPQQAGRGDWALALPVGWRRHEDGRVGNDPDVAGPHTLTLVCQRFLARPAVSPGVRPVREPGRRRPRRHRHGATVWRPPTVAAVMALVRHPASTGTCVDGTTRPPPAAPAVPRRREGEGAPPLPRLYDLGDL